MFLQPVKVGCESLTVNYTLAFRLGCAGMLLTVAFINAYSGCVMQSRISAAQLGDTAYGINVDRAVKWFASMQAETGLICNSCHAGRRTIQVGMEDRRQIS